MSEGWKYGTSSGYLVRHCDKEVPSFKFCMCRTESPSSSPLTTYSSPGNYVIDHDSRDRLIFGNVHHSHQQIFFENLSPGLYMHQPSPKLDSQAVLWHGLSALRKPAAKPPNTCGDVDSCGDATKNSFCSLQPHLSLRKGASTSV